jgi:hypothetical protein
LEVAAEVKQRDLSAKYLEPSWIEGETHTGR